MIKKCATKLVYLACLFIALAAPPNLHAQTYTLSDGQRSSFTTPPGQGLGQASADNGSQTMALSPPAEPAGDPTQGQVFSVSETGMSQSAEGEAGGIGGVVNLITSGYNAVQLSGGGGFDDQGWMAVLPLTPGQVSSGSLIFTQNYILNTITSREWAASYSAYGKGTPQYGGLFTEPATWTPSAGIVAPGDSPKKNQGFPGREHHHPASGCGHEHLFQSNDIGDVVPWWARAERSGFSLVVNFGLECDVNLVERSASFD